MLALFYAKRILDGKANFTATDHKDPMFIPPIFKQPAADIVLKAGVHWLIPVEYKGTLE